MSYEDINPRLPTNSIPGSPERMDVYTARLESKLPLHNQDDVNDNDAHYTFLRTTRNGHHRKEFHNDMVPSGADKVCCDLQAFAEKLRKTRELKGISLAALAEKVGVSRESFRAYEQAKAEPKLMTFVLIAEVLDVPVLELLTPLPQCD